MYDEPSLDECVTAYNLNGIHPAADLFPLITGQEFQDLCNSIGNQGLEMPVVLTHDGFLLDGRNRLRALLATGATERFQTLGEFYASDYPGYVMRLNLHRRHLSSEERKVLYLKLRELRGVREHGQRSGNQYTSEDTSNDVSSPPRQPVYASEIGVGVATVQRWESDAKILDKSPDLKEAVLAGKMPVAEAVAIIEKVEQAIAKQAPPAEPVAKPAEQAHPVVTVITVDGKRKDIQKPKATHFNRTNGNVEWASWTWNPITGCLHGCNFCYARAITYNGKMAANYPFGFEPAFYEYRLEAPKNTRIPVDSNNPSDGRVFVGSMADVFGKWVPDEWIQKIFDACMEAPGWEYLFLTKWPNRYKMLESLPKAWFGASVIQQSDVQRVEREMKSFETTGIKWISLEPMLEQITFNDLSWCNLVVIGAQTATQQPSGYVPEKAADFEWVWDVVRQCKDAGVPYYLKPNLLQSPGMILPKGEPS
jgi:protein gp37